MAILKIKNTHFPSVFIVLIHNLRTRFTNFIQHDVIFDNCCDPIITEKVCTVNRQNLHFWVSSKLFKNILKSPAAKKDFAIDKKMRSKRPSFGLTTICGQNVECLSLVQKFAYFNSSILNQKMSYSYTTHSVNSFQSAVT